MSIWLFKAVKLTQIRESVTKKSVTFYRRESKKDCSSVSVWKKSDASAVSPDKAYPA